MKRLTVATAILAFIALVVVGSLTLASCGGAEATQPPQPVSTPTMVGPNGGVFTTECVSTYWEYTFALADYYDGLLNKQVVDDKLNTLIAKCPDPRVHNYPELR